MKATRFSKLALAVSAAVILGVQALAQQTTTTTPASRRLIVVSLEDHKLALLEDGHLKKVYSVAVGKPYTPSPVGTFSIERKVMNPTYHHSGKTVLPGPGNPVGTRWMGLNVQGYGIHGTNEPKSIGKAASHGCIRMAKADLEEFYELVAAGDTVELIDRRNDETAQLFGADQKPTTTETTLAVNSVTPRDQSASVDAIPAAESFLTSRAAVGGSW
jgi:lipoprotein-anchoring transpeptidase ErfK/SrfK